MKIKLDDRHYLITEDRNAYITTTIRNKDGSVKMNKNGEPVLRRVSGYYSTFGECVEDYIERRINSAESATISELKDYVRELEDEVRGWII